MARELKERFTKDAIQNMKVDFVANNLFIAIDKNKVIRFLCYFSNIKSRQRNNVF